MHLQQRPHVLSHRHRQDAKYQLGQDPGQFGKRIPSHWSLVANYSACGRSNLYWDRVVAAQVFRVSVWKAFAHMPHAVRELQCTPRAPVILNDCGSY
jgi:hypothetical protein